MFFNGYFRGLMSVTFLYLFLRFNSKKQKKNTTIGFIFFFTIKKIRLRDIKQISEMGNLFGMLFENVFFVVAKLFKVLQTKFFAI